MKKQRYLVIPLVNYSEVKETLEEAKQECEELTKKFVNDTSGFCILQVEFVGAYEVVSPVWNDLDPLIPAVEPPAIGPSPNWDARSPVSQERL